MSSRLISMFALLTLIIASCGGNDPSEPTAPTTSADLSETDETTADTGASEAADSSTSEPDTPSPDAVEPETDAIESAEPETAEADAETSDVETSDIDADGETQASSNPAADEIRSAVESQGVQLGWNEQQTGCMAEGIIATGATTPSELSDQAYWEISIACDSLRPTLGFLFGAFSSPTVGTCLAEALDESELGSIGAAALIDATQTDTQNALEAALDLHPECAG